MEDPSSTNDPQAPKFPSPSNMFQKLRTNLAIRSTWGEINGAMGDLGTYIPIVLAMTLAKDLNLGTTLIFTGVYNMVTGAVYGVPMPVQPMKAITAAGISSADFGIPEVMAAGICTGAILVLLGITGLMQLVYRLIPLSVNFSKSKAAGNRHWFGLDGLVLAIVCACFIVIINGAGEENEERQSNQELGDDIENQSSRLLCRVGSSHSRADESGRVLVWGHALLPWRRWPGEGQYKFGGRSGGCVAILGIAKLILGLVLGSSIVKVLDQFPVGVLGVLLLFAGTELAMAARDMNSKEETFVMMICLQRFLSLDLVQRSGFFVGLWFMCCLG
ncbi:hypothetical protein NL676_033966 [Syzygium grande]|nr:hypothetical protein NL676_033966 [Syzygium grande]